MTGDWLLVAHIAVLGYWLGAELVINGLYRFICYRGDLPFTARDAMMDHLMDADQHVRYALLLQLTLGSMLAAKLNYAAPDLFWIAPIAGIAWLGLVELVHRRRKTALGQRLATFDRGLRYVLLIALLVVGCGMIPALPFWLQLKLLAFAAVVACGIGIRFALIRHFGLWQDMAANGASAHGNQIIQQTYVRATAILILLWVFIALIVSLSVLKP